MADAVCMTGNSCCYEYQLPRMDPCDALPRVHCDTHTGSCLVYKIGHRVVGQTLVVASIVNLRVHVVEAVAVIALKFIHSSLMKHNVKPFNCRTYLVLFWFCRIRVLYCLQIYYFLQIRQTGVLRYVIRQCRHQLRDFDHFRHSVRHRYLYFQGANFSSIITVA